MHHRGLVLLLATAGLLASLLCQPSAAATEVEDRVQKALEAGLQGRVDRAMALLRPLEAETLTDTQRAYRTCMLDRFGGDGPPAAALPADADPVVRAIVETFEQYWWSRLMQRAPEGDSIDGASSDLALTQRLAIAVGQPATAPADTIDDRLQALLATRGLHALLGTTPPLRDLMLWRHEERRTFHVQLPEGPYDTTVVLLNDFIANGWIGYATCGRHGAGGWAVRDALYAVTPRYESLESEPFRVSLLSHETQHFVDLNRHPDLPPWTLEYRAKLVELASADVTRVALLRKFAGNQSDDPGLPHPYANRRVLVSLRQEPSAADDDDLESIAPARLRSACLSVLSRSSAQLAPR